MASLATLGFDLSFTFCPGHDTRTQRVLSTGRFPFPLGDGMEYSAGARVSVDSALLVSSSVRGENIPLVCEIGVDTATLAGRASLTCLEITGVLKAKVEVAVPVSVVESEAVDVVAAVAVGVVEADTVGAVVEVVRAFVAGSTVVLLIIGLSTVAPAASGEANPPLLVLLRGPV